MNWEAIGAIGEVVGAVAVIVTLFYLAYQVRHARSEMKQSFALAHEQADRELGLEQIRNEILNSASRKMVAAGGELTGTILALKEYGNLTDEEAIALNTFMAVRFRMYTDQIRNIKLLNEAQIQTLRRRLKFNYSRVPSKVWFDVYASRNKNDPIVQYVEEVRSSELDVPGGRDV